MNPNLPLSLPNHLAQVLKSNFSENRVHALFAEFLHHNAYNEDFVLELLEMAKGRKVNSWVIRRLATLMIENQLLRLSPVRRREFESILIRLKLKPNAEPGSEVKRSVLKEGFSTTHLPQFIIEFRRRLQRLDRVHRGIQGKRTSARALEDFIALAQRDCKLSLARYLWSPREVADRLLDDLELSGGVKDIYILDHPYADDEAGHSLSRISDFDAELVKLLAESSDIYWIATSTSSELNSLLEYPIGTVVLVVKPPGSDLEFELKRAGIKGAHPLDIVYRRNGEIVPYTHHLQGGSMGYLLRWEAGAAALMSRIYRLMHGEQAPVSRTISISSIHTIPAHEGEEHILRYFTDANAFGSGFRDMRAAMKDSINRLTNGADAVLPFSSDGPGLTGRFLGLVGPEQAILLGTSSFRLDRVAQYLSSNGPETYFRHGLALDYTNEDARRFAEEILEEILGVYTPARIRYRSYTQFLEAAFSVSENRARATGNYLSIMRQIGKFLGTLVAFKGHSHGESFVARNVGLKSFWDKGHWQVKIIFMDHDALDIVGKRLRRICPLRALQGMANDQKHIFGGRLATRAIRGAVEFLKEIYRIDDHTSASGLAELHGAMRDAYLKTREGLISCPKLQALFNQSALNQLLDLDVIIAGYLNLRDDPVEVESWRAETKAYLKKNNYNESLIKRTLKAIEKYGDSLNAYAFLY